MTGQKHFRFSFRYMAVMAVLLLAVIITGSALISASYQKTIVRYLKGYLGEHLLTRLSMDENIRFRFLKGFPNTTVEINNVLLLSGTDFSPGDFSSSFSDTLLYARSAYLQFNVYKMLRKKYELKKIRLSDGIINVLYDRKGHHNLNIWESGSGSKEYAIKLRNLVFDGVRIRVISVADDYSFDARSVRTNFKGSLASNVLAGDTRGHIRIRRFRIKEKDLVVNSDLNLDMSLIYSGDRFRVSRGNLQLNKAVAEFKGEYKGGKDREVDLTLDMPEFGLDELMSVIPGERSLSSGDYTFSGNGNLHLVVSGPLSKASRLRISSSFMLNNGVARNNSSRGSLSDLHLKGVVSGTNADNFRLEVDTFYARLGKGNIHGKMVMAGLKKLGFVSDIRAHVDLKELADFAGIDSIEKMEGFMRASFRASGSMQALDTFTSAVRVIQNGTFHFENAGIILKNPSLTLANITGTALWDEKIRFDSLTMRINETDIRASGEIHNLVSYLGHKGTLKSTLQIYCDNLDISKYLNRTANSSSSSGYKSLSIFPDRVYVKATLNSAKFTAGKFEAENVSADIAAVKDSVYLSRFRFGFPDGFITGTAIIRDEQDNYSVTCHAEPQKINIQQLFYEFNNFTQHFILDKNMKGQLGGKFDFYAKLDSSLKMIPGSVKARGDLTITNGELLQFEPMLKLSKYIDVEELRHIRFKTMKNTIYISDRMVSIPEMTINSSAFNISVSGQHSFDNQFDYRLRVLLSEVLFNKARKKKKEINEFLVEENTSDQTTIPLIIAGTPSLFDVKFDRKKAFSLSRTRNKEDQVIVKPGPENFRVEWEEPADVSSEKADRTESESSVVIEWEE